MRTLSLIVATFLAACGQPMPTSDAGPTSVAAGFDAGKALTCEAKFHVGPDGGCVQGLYWDAAPGLPEGSGRDHHVTYDFEVGGVHSLAITAGMDMGSRQIFTDTFVAPVLPDGGLGDWVLQQTGAIRPNSGAGVAVTNGRVYVLGGIVAADQSLSTTVSSAPLGAGTVGSFRAEVSFMGAARYHDVGFVHGGDVCVAGGFDGRAVFDEVECATPGADGVLGAFRVVTRLPTPRTHMAVAVVAGKLYVVGGFDLVGGVLPVDVYDFATNTWSKTSPLPSRHRTHALSVWSGYLVLVNGEDGDGASLGNAFSRLLRAKLNADGTLGPWEDFSVNPVGRRHTHQAPVINDILYSCEGTDQNDRVIDGCTTARVF